MPQILTVLASPRPDGLTASMLDIAESELRSAGMTVCRVNVSRLRFRPCRACMSCRSAGRCSLPADDAHTVADLLSSADGVIIAAPTYLGGIPGETKMLFDRLVSALMDTSGGKIPVPLHRGKPLAIINASTTPWPANRIPAFNSVKNDIRRIFRPAGFRHFDAMLLGDSRRIHVISPKTAGALRRMARAHASKAQKNFAKQQKNQ